MENTEKQNQMCDEHAVDELFRILFQTMWISRYQPSYDHPLYVGFKKRVMELARDMSLRKRDEELDVLRARSVRRMAELSEDVVQLVDMGIISPAQRDVVLRIFDRIVFRDEPSDASI